MPDRPHICRVEFDCDIFGITGRDRTNLVVGIDPGNTGAGVVTDGKDFLGFFAMPMRKDGRLCSERLTGYLKTVLPEVRHIFLERAIPMAMGSKGAFTYGRTFEALLMAVERTGTPFTLVEPARWAKEMHDGVSKDLRPKAKSLLAVKRLFPKLVGLLPVKPKSKVLLDGPVDALLIAGYGLRRLRPEWATVPLKTGKPVKTVEPDEADFW